MRRSETSLVAELQAHPYRFEFFQTMRLLTQALQDQGTLSGAGHAFLEERIRFSNRVGLSFPTSELESIQVEWAGALDQEGAEASRPLTEATRVWLTPTFMSLLGPNGTLPLHYTEQMSEHVVRHKEDGPHRFMDMLSSRSLMLFYRAWRKYRLEFLNDGSRDPYLQLLTALAGLPKQTEAPSAQVASLPNTAFAYYSSAIRQRPASLGLIERLLNDYFKVSIRLVPLMGRWLEVPLAQQTALGHGACRLGEGTIVGSRVWQCDLSVGVEIGPLPWSAFLHFLPHAEGAKALEQWLRVLTGSSLEYEVHLSLLTETEHSVCLNEAGSVGLGWNSYLSDTNPPPCRQDVRYRLHALEAAG